MKEQALDRVEAGMRFEDRDYRSAGRQVEVVAVDGSHTGFAHCRVVASPSSPSTVGRDTRIRKETLRRRFRPVEEDRSAGRWCATCQRNGSHHTDRHPAEP